MVDIRLQGKAFLLTAAMSLVSFGVNMISENLTIAVISIVLGLVLAFSYTYLVERQVVARVLGDAERLVERVSEVIKDRD
ncbi:MAG: hypothetical protein QXU69_10875 [Thermofilaceae archaeon]